ncbi:MAG: histidine--tRNA ligase [Parcubacteria bacterium C7867-004]|nr:MAG: histidine--tRNA ligase [Parcubacteria bacterium C7867-004]
MSNKDGLSTDSYKGVRDFYPADWGRLQAAFGRVRETLSSWGYEEYQASPLERSELYESKGNEEIIRDQTYSFEDRGGRRVTLRPEMTPTLARMVSGKRRELAFPLRWFSIGNRFRYERPQKGRLREFFQTDVDLIGLPEGEADLEILTLASAVFRAFGASDSDFTIRINSRPLLSAACRAAGVTDAEGVKEYWLLLDRKAKMSPEEFDAARGTTIDPLRAIEDATDPLVKAEKDKVLAMIEELKKRGIENVVFEPEIVRGFDYYTGIVYEVQDTSPENPRALLGGGRYDGLVAMFGGDPIPAIGFAFGDVGLMDFLATHDLLPAALSAPELYIGTPSPSDIPLAQAFAESVRERGIRTFVNLGEKQLGDQIRDAVKRGIPYFVAYGTEEDNRKSVKVKTLATSEEEEVNVTVVAQHIHAKKN